MGNVHRSTTLEDVIQIEPSDFTKPSRQALEDNINELYANKIIHQVGLCICFYDLLSASDGLISANRSGTVNVKATFRIIVFRPFRGEIIEAKISNSTEKGIHLHTEFFSDIFIPAPQNLFSPSKFDKSEQVWIWTPETDAAEAPTPFYFDKHEQVRFRVEEELWTDLAPGDEDGISASAVAAAQRSGPQQRRELEGAAASRAGVGGTRQTEAKDDMGTARGSVEEAELSTEGKGQQRAWRLVGSMQQAGLGVCSWWEAERDAEAGLVEESG